MFNMHGGLRIAALSAVLLAGSCTSDNVGGLSPDGTENHPIIVEPTNNALSLPYSASEAGLLPEDSARFEAFVSAYMAGGNGAISVSAPAGPDSRAAIAYFGERLSDMGVPASHILVGTHEGGDGRVELGFMGYSARTDKCGDWSENLAETEANNTAPNFGCAVQQNVAAMVADPRDLLGPRTMGPEDASRRAVVMGKYEKGEITQADKNKSDKVNEQSGRQSDVEK